MNFTEEQIKLLGITQAGAACCSVISSIIVILIIIVLKRYNKITQRLIMYLNTAIFFNSTSFIIRGFGYNILHYKLVCQLTGYYGQLTAGLILSSIWCIIIEIVLNAWRQQGASKCLEIFYLILIFIVPSVTGTIPFIVNEYGRSSAWCWIRSMDDDGKRSTLGTVLQYVLWYIPLYTLILVGGCVYFIGICVIGVRIRKHSKLYSSDGSIEKQKSLLKELHQFRWYPVVYFFINLVPLANRLYEVFNADAAPLIELWIASGTIEGLQGIIVAIIFITHSSTRRQIMAKINCPRKKETDNNIRNGETTPLSHSVHNSYESMARVE